jgi:hypothetical protein
VFVLLFVGRRRTTDLTSVLGRRRGSGGRQLPGRAWSRADADVVVARPTHGSARPFVVLVWRRRRIAPGDAETARDSCRGPFSCYAFFDQLFSSFNLTFRFLTRSLPCPDKPAAATRIGRDWPRATTLSLRFTARVRRRPADALNGGKCLVAREIEQHYGWRADTSQRHGAAVV